MLPLEVSLLATYGAIQICSDWLIDWLILCKHKETHLVANSTPIVLLLSKLNSLRVNRDSRLLLPTPESPISTTTSTHIITYLHYTCSGKYRLLDVYSQWAINGPVCCHVRQQWTEGGNYEFIRREEVCGLVTGVSQLPDHIAGTPTCDTMEWQYQSDTF